MTTVMFVSVNESFDPNMSLPELEPWVAGDWATTVAKASAADRVIAVHDHRVRAAWRARGAFPHGTYQLSNGDTRPRVALALGDPLPLLDVYDNIPPLRRGCAVVDLACTPLPDER